MRQCLTSPQGGYYTTTRERSDQFGRKGDFITSPEISQVFGELVAVWFVTEWMAQGRRSSGVQLTEVGPGRGTLMDDVLRTISTFKAFANSIEVVYLVEASEGLREAQKRLLCGEEIKMEKTGMGWRCLSKYSGIPLEWVEEINLLPKDGEKEKMPFIVAHEFFDALPIHAFESVPPSPVQQDPTPQLLDANGKPLPTSQPSTSAASTARDPQWRELLVTPTSKRSTLTRLNAESIPDFHLTHALSPTPLSLLLPESSTRYKALKSRPGSSIEISPDSCRHVADFALRIGGPASSRASSRASGAALVIDYGPSSTVPVNSLRGIKAHGRVSPFSEPGSVDLSADVDFTALAGAATKASEGVEVWGPVEQGDFLAEMGGEFRVQQLIKRLETLAEKRKPGFGEEQGLEEKKRAIEGAWKRLVDKAGPQGMGRIYKAMALVPEGGGTRAPVGFGGEVGQR